MRRVLGLCAVALCSAGCMQTTHEHNVLRTDNVFKPQGQRRVSPELELEIDRVNRVATLQHPSRCDGVTRSTAEIESVTRERPSVATYIFSSLAMATGAIGVAQDGPDTANTVIFAMGAGVLTTMLLISSTERKTHFEQQWLPQNDYPCGGMPARYIDVRVGLGAGAVDRRTDSDGMISLPGYLSVTDLPAAFVDGKAIPVRFLEVKPAPVLPMAPSGVSAPSLEAR
ncbi:MAG: hypothetical protein R3B07_01750 [Polyangiaceae bacterium]